MQPIQRPAYFMLEVDDKFIFRTIRIVQSMRVGYFGFGILSVVGLMVHNIFYYLICILVIIKTEMSFGLQSYMTNNILSSNINTLITTRRTLELIYMI